LVRYQKGHKDESRQRIMEVAADRFRSDGIAASGLAAIMSDAGLTNGAFYPHFPSKADLVRESIAAALDRQIELIRTILPQGGIEAAIGGYLSHEHRDDPRGGCALAALLPELARQPLEARRVYAERFAMIARELASVLPKNIEDREATAIGLFMTLVGTLQLARTVKGTEMSDRVLAAGREAARKLVRN